MVSLLLSVADGLDLQSHKPNMESDSTCTATHSFPVLSLWTLPARGNQALHGENIARCVADEAHLTYLLGKILLSRGLLLMPKAPGGTPAKFRTPLDDRRSLFSASLDSFNLPFDLFAWSQAMVECSVAAQYQMSWTGLENDASFVACWTLLPSDRIGTGMFVYAMVQFIVQGC